MSAVTPRPVSDRKFVALDDVVVAGGGDDRPGEGVFAVGLDGGGDAQHPVVVERGRFRRRR